jgi:formate dehydrogenase subunit delta
VSPAQLIKMANQIGAFFEAMPDAAQATAGIADHIRKFWEPRMREALEAHIAAHGDEELTPTVRRALLAMRNGE